MTFSSVFEIAKIIAVLFGLLILITGSIAIVSVIIVFSFVGLKKVIYECCVNFIDADVLKNRLDVARSSYPPACEYATAIRHAKEIIDHMVEGD